MVTIYTTDNLEFKALMGLLQQQNYYALQLAAEAILASRNHSYSRGACQVSYDLNKGVFHVSSELKMPEVATKKEAITADENRLGSWITTINKERGTAYNYMRGAKINQFHFYNGDELCVTGSIDEIKAWYEKHYNKIADNHM